MLSHDRQIADVEFVAFDLETTGLFPVVSRIVEFEDAIHNAISLGGDADTMACIAGGIAEAYWGVPHGIEQRTLGLRDGRLRQVVDEFNHRFKTPPRGGTD